MFWCTPQDRNKQRWEELQWQVQNIWCQIFFCEKEKDWYIFEQWMFFLDVWLFTFKYISWYSQLSWTPLCQNLYLSFILVLLSTKAFIFIFLIILFLQKRSAPSDHLHQCNGKSEEHNWRHFHYFLNKNLWDCSIDSFYLSIIYDSRYDCV